MLLTPSPSHITMANNNISIISNVDNLSNSNNTLRNTLNTNNISNFNHKNKSIQHYKLFNDDNEIHQTIDNDLNDNLFNRKNGLLICSWNINGFTFNIETKLNYIIHTKKLDIITVQEGSKVYQDPNYIFHIKNYKSYAMQNGYGKVITLVRNGIYHENIEIDFNPNKEIDDEINKLSKSIDNYEEKRKGLLMSKLYVTTTEIWSPEDNFKYLVVNYYRPQNGTEGGSDVNLLLQYLKLISSKSKFKKHGIIVTGDGNVHNERWMNNVIKNKYSPASRNGNTLVNWVDENKYSILNNGDPTRIMNDQETAPDITLINDRIDMNKTDWWIEDNGRGKLASDHLTIYTLIQMGNIYDDVKIEYSIRTGDNLDWTSWNEKMDYYLQIWNKKHGHKLSRALNEYKNKKEEERDMDELLKKYCINHQDIITATDHLVEEVIIKAAKEVFGIRIKNGKNSVPWMTAEIKAIIEDYDNYKKKFNYWSKRKKKKNKHILNELRNKKENICDEGRIKWIQEQIRRNNVNGLSSWNEINNIIQYDSASNTSIPNWYNKETKESEGVTSKEKAETYLDYIHRFDDSKQQSFDNNDLNDNKDYYEELIEDYKKKRWQNISNQKLKEEQQILNGIITRKAIERSILSFNKDSAIGDDGISHKYLQKGIGVLLNPIYIVYNMMFLSGSRSPKLNLRTITILPKGNKPKQFKESWRPISICSNFGKPMDKIMAYRFLSFGIRLKIIKLRNFGFIKGLGCFDAIAYLLEIVWNNRIIHKETHLLFIDYHAAFDTVDHESFFEVMEIDFKIIGHSLDYIIASLSCRWGRVKVNGHYSEWRRDVIGLGQGWPPSPIFYIFYTLDVDIINDLKLGIVLIGYADDNSLVSDGSIMGDDLERNLNLCIDLIYYISNKKKLIMEKSKQKYMVISDEKDQIKHDHLYFELKIDEEKIDEVHSHIRYLGVILDCNLDWNQHINNLHKNGRNAFIKVYNRYRNASKMRAKWLPQIYQSFVVSKLMYGIEFWGSAEDKCLKKLRTLYNDIVRHCNGAERSSPLDHQFMQIGWMKFDDLILYKQSVMWSRIIRSPDTNIINQEISRIFWKDWMKERNEDKLILKDYGDIIERNSECIEKISLHGIKPTEININGGLKKNVISNDDWHKKDRMMSPFVGKIKKKKRKKKMMHPFYTAFQAAKQLQTSDYVFMKNVDYQMIPKRLSYHEEVLIKPVNLQYNEWSPNGSKCSFSIDWMKELAEDYGFTYESLQIIMSDGSTKEGYGGSGYFSCNLSYYIKKLDISKLRKDKYVDYASRNNDSDTPWNGISNYCYGSNSIGLRCSIEHCELDAAKNALSDLYRYIWEIFKKDEKKIPELLILAIDSETVVKWIGGTYQPRDALVYGKIKEIYKLINDYNDFDIEVHLIWVKAHNEEKGNELADDFAKLGMLNLYQTKSWVHYEKKWDKNEWYNFSYNAAKKESKRKSFYNTLNGWKDYKKRKKEEMRNDKKVLSRNLVEWDIKYSYAYKYELNNLTKREWSYLCGFRSGHNKLKAHKKYGVDNKLCIQDNCIEEETIEHYLFYCDEYKEQRMGLYYDVNQVYSKHYNQSFNSRNNEDKLRFLLFPFQDELNMASIKNDKASQNELLLERINVIHCLMNYINLSNRFKEGVDKTYFTF